MDDKNEIKKLLDKEKEYEDLFEKFLNSAEEKTFSKSEVEKIIEAHIFKEVLGNYQQSDRKTKKKNLLVTSKEISAKLFNFNYLFNFLITYLFYIGFLLLINEFLYPNLFINKPTVFIIGVGFTLIDKLVKPFIFIADLVSFTFHKVGLITLTIYTLIFYFVSSYLGEQITFGQSIIIAVLVLVGIALIEYLKRDSLFRTKYIDDDFDLNGRDEDE